MKTPITHKYLWFIASLSVIFLLAGCAQNEVVEQCLKGHTYGFLGGLWHGFIAPFDFIGMLFKGANRVRTRGVSFRSQRFDKAEIVE